MQLSFAVVSDRESFKTPEASLNTQDPGKRHTHITQMTHCWSVKRLNTKQNLPIVAEIMIYDKVVKKMASRVPLGIATVGF